MGGFEPRIGFRWIGVHSGNWPPVARLLRADYDGMFPFSPESATMRHVLSALVQNVPGVLAHVAGMFASRGYNIDSLAVGETEEPHLSRMTFVVVGDDAVLDQVRKQLEKIVTVVRVDDISSQEYVERDVMLLKVKCDQQVSEIRELCQIFRGKVVDVSTNQVIVEISGPEKKVQAFIELMRPFGIIELVRTGRIAMVRGTQHVHESSSIRAVADEPAITPSE